jgi:DNA-binding FadR family transcriptional regulator
MHDTIVQLVRPIYPSVYSLIFADLRMNSPVQEPQRLYRQLAQQLREWMLASGFEAGARLPAERDLATQWGVSRSSLREAVIALEVEGAIEVRTGSGIYVTALALKPLPVTAARPATVGPGDWGPLEVMQARELIESEMAALAALNASRSDLQAMAKALTQMKKEIGRNQVPRHGDEAFHMAIAKACGNSVLLDTLHGYWQARSGAIFERLSDYFEKPASWQTALAEHETIYQALCEQDALGAKRAMKHHLKQTHKRYNAHWHSV